MMQMKQSILVFFLLTVTVGMAHAATTQVDEEIDLKALYQQIDDAISQSPQYVAEREQKIDACRNRLQREKDAEKSVTIAEELFLLYQPLISVLVASLSKSIVEITSLAAFTKR